MWTWLLLIVVAYLAGSIPFGYLIGRAKGIDIRQHGSRNIGATNVGRVLGRKLGIICFVLDAAKGAAPVIAAGRLMDVWGKPASALAPAELGWWLGVAMAALVGHMLSPWLGFKGGKGVATGFGALAAMWPLMTIPAFIALGIWIVVLMLTRYVSLSSIVAAMSLPVSAFLLNRSGGDVTGSIGLLVGVCAALAALVIYRHRANIGRLMRGEESRVGRRGKSG